MSTTIGRAVSSVYVHVPFCAHKCEYCAFYSEASNGAKIQRYVDALVLELGSISPPPAGLNTVFFGGGTPSLLSLRQWQQIFAAMERAKLLGSAEWTIECNPATVSLDKARLWREHGVNRVSMGVQSFDEALLERLGRIHSRAMVFKSFETLRQGGFDNINVDLMFAIPGQTPEIWQETLDQAFGLESEHLSCYEVIYEEDTPLYAQLKAGQFDVDEDLACSLYEQLIEQATAAGFTQYEIANFARALPTDPDQPNPGRACRHNINYWRGGSFHGLGPSAAGFVNGVRTKNCSNTDLYCSQLLAGGRPTEWQENLSPLQRAGEIAAFGLRMNSGWPFLDFQQATGFDLRTGWGPEMDELQSKDWARIEPTRFRLTSQGLRFADAAAELFLR